MTDAWRRTRRWIRVNEWNQKDEERSVLRWNQCSPSPLPLSFKVISFFHLSSIFSLYFPYQSILIIGRLTPPLSVSTLSSSSPPVKKRGQKKETGRKKRSETQTHNEVIHLSNQRGGSPEESKHPSLSASLSLSLVLSASP